VDADLGYTLANLIGVQPSTGLTVAHIDAAREHFIAHVRAAGPLPFVRAGRQPYGVLPVTLLLDWSPPAGQETALAVDVWLKRLLAQLRELWRQRLPDGARVARSTDAAQDLAAVLRSDGVGHSYRTRHLLGPQYLAHLHAFLGEDLAARGWIAARDALTDAVLDQLGQLWHPRLSGAAYDERDRALSAPLVQAAPADGTSTTTLAPNYIAALLAAPPLPLTESDAPPAPAPPATLLHLLLRHALQLEYTWAAARLVSAQPGRPGSPPCCATSSWSTSAHRARRRGACCSAGRARRRQARRRRSSSPRSRRSTPKCPRSPRSAASAPRSRTSRRSTRTHSSASRPARSTSRRIGSMPGSRRSPPSASPHCAPSSPRACASAPTAGWRT
jgi:hypothetical protein